MSFFGGSMTPGLLKLLGLGGGGGKAAPAATATATAPTTATSQGATGRKSQEDGTFTAGGVYFGGRIWPRDLAPYLFNAISGTAEPLPEKLYNKYKDTLQYNERNYGPWQAILSLSTQWFEVELPQIEKELAESAGISVEGAGEGAPLGDAPFAPIGEILGMGGRAAREMAYQDPASFINLLATEAAGDTPTNSMLRNFLISQAPRLYQLAGLSELIGRDPTVGGPERVQDIFGQFVTPGEEGGFAGRRANVVADLGALATLPGKQPGAAGQNPWDFFNPAFYLAADTLAPTMTPTAAATLFSNERRDLERALYTTAVTQGKFTGSPLEWLQKQGFF